jgi:hypothetical protein
LANPFSAAQRKKTKARVAVAGPTGGGKTINGLAWGIVLAGDRRLAVIDTENGSASKYKDETFHGVVLDFDVVDFAPPYRPEKYIELISLAEENGYGAVLIDSLSHGWMGPRRRPRDGEQGHPGE